MRRRWWRIAAEVLLAIAVTVVAAWSFGRAPAKQAGDEANWVGTARYFLVAVVQRDLSADAWADSYWTRTQPMVPRYIMGGWLWARGVPFEHLDPAFDHTKKWFTNVREGKAPDEATLDEVRVPMRALAALSAVLLYGVVRVMAGPIGGLAAALLYCGSSYVPLHMVRAMGEPPFMAFLLATLLVSLLGIQRSARRGPSIGLGIAVGLLLGLAFSSKLTAIIAMLAIILWGVRAAVGEPLARRLTGLRAGSTGAPTVPVRLVGRRWLVWSLGVVALAVLTFVATNPFLYRDPVGRMLLLFQNRQTEMAAQAEFDPSRAVTNLPDRIERVWTASLIEDTWADRRLRWPLEAALAIVGFAWLVARAVRPQANAEAFLLLWVAGFFGGVSFALGYVLDHYFIPTATFGIVLAGLAVGWSAQLAWQLARRRLPISDYGALTNSRLPFGNDSART